jgi:hypothetical protein
MNQQLPVDDSACPTAFVALPAVIGGLIWLYAIVSSLPAY